MKSFLSTGIVLMLFISQMAFAQTAPPSPGRGISVSATTDQGAYYISTLNSNPIVVNVFVENNTDEWLVLTEDYRKLNNFAEFGNISIKAALKSGESSPINYQAVKGLAFKPSTLPAYQNVFTNEVVNIFRKQVSGAYIDVAGIYIGPHTKQMVARAEVKASDFIGVPQAAGYKISVRFLAKTIWNWTTQADLPGIPGTNPFEVITFVRLK